MGSLKKTIGQNFQLFFLFVPAYPLPLYSHIGSFVRTTSIFNIHHPTEKTMILSKPTQRWNFERLGKAVYAAIFGTLVDSIKL